MDLERAVGTLEEQGRWLAAKIDKMDAKLDDLLTLKWKIYGAAAVIAFLSSAAFQLFLFRGGK